MAELSTQTLMRLLLRNNIDLMTREIVLDEEISDKSFRKLDKQLKILEMCGTGDITLVVSSLGGCIYSMFGIIDRMRQSPCKINTLALGSVASAAIPILAAGTGKRECAKHTSLMYHQIAYGIGGVLRVHEDELDHTRNLAQRMNDFLDGATKKRKGTWANMVASGRDVWFDSAKALQLGLVDEIV